MTRLELANRIIDLDIYNARDYEETPETIAETIQNDPDTIIEYLLDVIDNI